MNFYLDLTIHFSLLMLNLGTFIFFKKKVSGSLNIIFYGLFIRLLFDFIAVFISMDGTLSRKFNGNMFIYHIFTPVEYLLYCYYFLLNFSSKKIRKAILFSMPFFVLFSVISTIAFQKYYAYNSYSLLLKYCLLIIWVMLFLKELLIEKPVENLLRLPAFWVSVAILFHSAINIFIDGFANFILENEPGDFKITYTIYSITNYILFLLLFVSLFVEIKNSKTTKSV
jgi:hypothetical protein